MKAVVFFSGGLGSALAAYIAKQQYEETVLYFNDTKTEDEDLYRFLNEFASFLDLPLITDTDGRDIWQVFEDVKYLGNSRIDPCSRVLKRERAQKYIRDNFNPKEYELVFGFDWSEEHRLNRAKDPWLPYDIRAPLLDGLVDKTRLWKEVSYISGISAPRLYAYGFTHNNCGGFCVKAGLEQFRKLYLSMPDRYKYHENKEQELIEKISTVKPFLRKIVKGEVKYLTLKDYRETYLEKNIQLSFLEQIDHGGCGCYI